MLSFVTKYKDVLVRPWKLKKTAGLHHGQERNLITKTPLETRIERDACMYHIEPCLVRKVSLNVNETGVREKA